MDNLSQRDRSKCMSRIGSKNSMPEMVVRSLLHKKGFRYKLHDSKLPGKPDIVFSSRKKIIFIHGCFWHRHKGCKYAVLPKTRINYWNPKLATNVERDKKNEQLLRKLGWRSLVLWECELKDIFVAENKVLTFLNGQ